MELEFGVGHFLAIFVLAGLNPSHIVLATCLTITILIRNEMDDIREGFYISLISTHPADESAL